jgi:hypothetical protein
MSPACFSPFWLPRFLALVVSLCLPLAAQADEYAEVNRLLRSGSAAQATLAIRRCASCAE